MGGGSTGHLSRPRPRRAFGLRPSLTQAVPHSSRYVTLHHPHTYRHIPSIPAFQEQTVLHERLQNGVRHGSTWNAHRQNPRPSCYCIGDTVLVLSPSCCSPDTSPWQKPCCPARARSSRSKARAPSGSSRPARPASPAASRSAPCSAPSRRSDWPRESFVQLGRGSVLHYSRCVVLVASRVFFVSLQKRVILWMYLGIRNAAMPGVAAVRLSKRKWVAGGANQHAFPRSSISSPT